MDDRYSASLVNAVAAGIGAKSVPAPATIISEINGALADAIRLAANVESVVVALIGDYPALKADSEVPPPTGGDLGALLTTAEIAKRRMGDAGTELHRLLNTIGSSAKLS